MKQCEMCNRSQPETNYAPTSSAFFPSNHINVCYSCLEEMVDGNDLNQVDRLCQHINVAFLPNEWRKIWTREGKESFKKYFNSYYDMNYTKYDWGEQNEKLMQKAREGIINNELDELSDELIQELKMEWGDMPKLSLLRMEKFFNSSLGDYNVQTEVERDMLKKAARISMLIDNQLIEGIIDKDATSQYDKIINSVLKQLETSQSEGISSISQVVEFIEKNGFQPKFYEGIPRDEIDMMEKNIQEYLRDLVHSEVNLTELFEKKWKEKKGDS